MAKDTAPDATIPAADTVAAKDESLPAHSPLGASSAERWTLHPLYPIEASSEGRVRYPSGFVIKPRLDRDGYALVDFGPKGGRRTVKVHRVVHAAFSGVVSALEVDHLNRVRNDNRPENLRYLTISANRRNVGVRRNNTSGVRNVRWRKDRDCWQAYARVDGRFKSLGHFADLAAATEIAEVHYGCP